MKTYLRQREESPLVAPAAEDGVGQTQQCLTVFPWQHDRRSDHEEVCMEAIVERCTGIDIVKGARIHVRLVPGMAQC